MSDHQPDDPQMLYKVIHGSLQGSINDHGPIDRPYIGSATKRLVGQIRGYWLQAANIEQQAAVRHMRKKYDRLRHGHMRALDRIARLEEENRGLREQCATVNGGNANVISKVFDE